jgi:hypothetical protein
MKEQSRHLNDCTQKLSSTPNGRPWSAELRCGMWGLFHVWPYPDLLHLLEEQYRRIAQAVSPRLPTAAARVQTQVWSCGIL